MVSDAEVVTLSKRVMSAACPSTSTCCLGRVRILGEVCKKRLLSGRDNTRPSSEIVLDPLQEGHGILTTRSLLRHAQRDRSFSPRAQDGRSSNPLIEAGIA